MTTPLPLNEKPFFNTDAIANSISANDMFDCYLEPVPGVGFVTRRRPGLKLFTDLNTTVQGDGLFWWESAGKLIAVSNGQVFNISQDGSFTNITGESLIIGTPVTFADGQDIAGSPWLYMANGKLVYATGHNTIAPTDPNTPKATHTTFVKGMFQANNVGTNQFLFTDTNPATGLMDNAYWSSTDNPLTCEAKGDNLLSLHAAWQELYAWGSEGLEIWQDDGVTPFSPIQGAFSEGGIEAPYSVVVADNTVFALCVIAGARVVVKLQGRAPVVCSEAIARVLADMPYVGDAIGDLVSVGGMAIYLLSFPTAKQTWAYDYKNDVWTRWGYYRVDEHEQFIGQHSCFVKPWNKHLIMSRVDGKIYELDRNTFDDAGVNMVSFRRTGWINHGTYNRKICDQFYIKCKAGMGDIGTLLVRWRDEGKEEWSSFMEVTLSPIGQRDFTAKMNRMGMYRSRQYEFRLSDGVDLVLVGVDTELRVLSS
jgi:hypothetical protein